MKFPFTSSVGITPRQYYRSALKNYQESPAYSGGPQSLPIPYTQQGIGVGKFALGLAGLAGLGMVPVAGSNVFSKVYMPAIRSVEEFSPGKILRTFQTSNILSQFETAALQTRAISPATLEGNSVLKNYFSALTGRNFFLQENIDRGLLYHKGSLYLGQTTDEAVKRNFLGKAAVILNTNHSPRFSSAVARSVGVDGSLNKAFKESQIIVGKNAAHLYYRQAAGYGAGLVERFNKLSTEIAVHRLPIVGHSIHDFLQRAGLGAITHLGVEKGPALRTFAKLTGKWSAAIGAAAFGYGSIDYLSSKFLGKGPTQLAADTWVGGNLLAAGLADSSGFHAYRERQETIAPGSTSLVKLSALPAMGAVAGYALHYGQGASMQAILTRRLGSIDHASRVTERILNRFAGVSAERGVGLLRAAGPGTRWFHKLGRWLKSADILGSSHLGPGGLKALIGATVGAAVIAPFIPGALAPSKSRQELEDIYSGRSEVPIRKNRWWELGRSPIEGDYIEYYRPHWYPLMKTHARDISIYGGQRSPITKFLTSNFTYGLERKHYYDRPYPITGTAFEDVPFIGPLLSTTIGRIIKPPLRMHEDETQRIGPNGEEQYKFLRQGFGGVRATELGEVTPGTPISPYGVKATAGGMVHRLTEMIGLPGFMFKAFKEQITGEEGTFTQESRLQSSYRMYGVERNFWDRELGGGGPAGELLRRVFLHRERSIPEYNPIRNQMPTWLPGENSHAIDFQHGDPFIKITMGEVRLPGEGYAALHPELKGVDPSKYPDVYKLKILSDIAPYSDEFKKYKGILLGKKKAGILSEDESSMVTAAIDQQASRAQRKTFDEYKYDSMEHLSAYNKKLRRKGKAPIGPVGALVGKYWEVLSHGAETPLEYLTPISPAFKLLHQRSAIEDYERTQLYGTTNAFWTSPIRDFLQPFATASAHSLGRGGVPSRVEHIRGIESYFDTLKYIKFTRLKNIAIAAHDGGAATEFESRRRETLFGVNPYTMDFSEIFRSLPPRDRDYFKAFSEADTEKDREKILAMIPKNERPLFIARWEMNKAEEIKAKVRAGTASSSDKKQLEGIFDEAHFEGMPHDSSLMNEYKRTRLSNEEYADWYRRTRLLESALEGQALPGPDFVGYHPAVDLEDVKLKLVKSLGEDMHDYNLWPSQDQEIALRPFINDNTVQQVIPDGSLGHSEIRRRLQELLSGMGVENLSVSIAMYPSHKPDYNVDLDVQEDRTEDIKKAWHRGI